MNDDAYKLADLAIKLYAAYNPPGTTQGRYQPSDYLLDAYKLVKKAAQTLENQKKD